MVVRLESALSDNRNAAQRAAFAQLQLHAEFAGRAVVETGPAAGAVAGCDGLCFLRDHECQYMGLGANLNAIRAAGTCAWILCGDA